MINQYKIKHISYSYSGGAGVVARRLSEYQRDILGLDSNFLFINKSNFRENPFGDPITLIRSLTDEYVIKRRREHSLLSLKRNKTNNNFMKRLNTKTDLYHLHWINGVLSVDTVINRIHPRNPIVWTLHDMESFTGGCHHALSCNKFENTCSNCPIVRPVFQNKVTQQHNEKIRLVKKVLHQNIAVVTPSLWLKAKAEKSSVFQNFIINSIYNPVENIYFTGLYQKSNKNQLEIIKNNFIVGFVSVDLNLPLKNFQLLKDVIQELNNSSFLNFKILAIGKNNNSQRQKDIYNVGKVNSSEEMLVHYNTMDVLAVTSKAESFGFSIAEAAACGVPSIVLAGSGSEELVCHNKTGFIAHSRREIYQFIREYAQNPDLVSIHGANARNKALRLFSEEKINRDYLKLYETFLTGIK